MSRTPVVITQMRKTNISFFQRARVLDEAAQEVDQDVGVERAIVRTGRPNPVNGFGSSLQSPGETTGRRPSSLDLACGRRSSAALRSLGPPTGCVRCHWAGQVAQCPRL